MAKKITKVVPKKATAKNTGKPKALKAKVDHSSVNDTEAVNREMKILNHPLEAVSEALRAIIKGVHADITEQWKWNAPSFSYKGYLVTFNLRPKDHVHLVFHNGAILEDPTGILEGDYPDRRMAYFKNLKEVKAKQPALKNLIQQWIELMNNA
jgi:hypothetical protein